MFGSIVTFIVGLVCVILGSMNMRGNISSLHYYHRSRVKEEDILPFGKIVGVGTITVGASVILFSFLINLAIAIDNNIYTIIGTVLMLVGMAVGIGITFYGMKKYNGGIF